jgi:hypothetical protein
MGGNELFFMAYCLLLLGNPISILVKLHYPKDRAYTPK